MSMDNSSRSLAFSLNNEHDEKTLFKISIVISLFFALLSFVVCFLSDSVAILTDALYTLGSAITQFLGLWVIAKLKTAHDENFHFGYFKLEPLMVMFDCVLTTAICFFSLALAVQEFFHADDISHYGLIITTQLITGIVAVFFGGYSRRRGKQWHSSLLETTGVLWFVEGAISIGTGCAFLCALFFHYLHWHRLAISMDPLITIALVLILFKEPFQFMKDSFLDLTDGRPRNLQERRIMRQIKECAQKLKVSIPLNYNIFKIRRAGRKYFVFLYLDISLFSPDVLKNLKKELNDQFNHLSSDIILHIVI